MAKRDLDHDGYARAARERIELAAARRDPAMALEACELANELFRHGYRLSTLMPDSGVKALPIRLRARGPLTCALCRDVIAQGDWIWWTKDVPGVECDGCGGKKAA